MTTIAMLTATLMMHLGVPPQLTVNDVAANPVPMEREHIVQEVAPDDDPGFDVEYPCPDKQAVA